MARPAAAEKPAPGQSVFDWAGHEPFPSHFVGVSAFDASDFNQVRRYLDWSVLFQKWEFPVRFPDVLDNADWGEAARTLLHDANNLLDDGLANGKLRADIVFGVWRAGAGGDQVVVRPATGGPVWFSFSRLPLPGEFTYCAADFIKPITVLKAGESDYIGGYAIRLDESPQEWTGQLAAAHDEYRSLLAADLCGLYRRAVADYLHYRLRRFIWGYCDDDDLSNEEVLNGLHQGIRVEVGGRECPDWAEQTKLLDLLHKDDWAFAGSSEGVDGLSAVLCGFFFAHPKSQNAPLEPAPDNSTYPARDLRWQGFARYGISS